MTNLVPAIELTHRLAALVLIAVWLGGTGWLLLRLRPFVPPRAFLGLVLLEAFGSACGAVALLGPGLYPPYADPLPWFLAPLLCALGAKGSTVEWLGVRRNGLAATKVRVKWRLLQLTVYLVGIGITALLRVASVPQPIEFGVVILCLSVVVFAEFKLDTSGRLPAWRR
jgi:hypothetical protein